jgi:hypothetical protein
MPIHPPSLTLPPPTPGTSNHLIQHFMVTVCNCGFYPHKRGDHQLSSPNLYTARAVNLKTEVFWFPIACFTFDVVNQALLALSNPIFLPPAYSPALIYFGRERAWWITCNYPTVLKEKNRKSTTCAIRWLKSVLHEEKCRTGSDSGVGEQTQQKKCWVSFDIRAEQENHNVGWGPT